MNKPTKKSLPQVMLAIAFMVVLSSCRSCDRERRGACEWQLVPDPERLDRTSPGMVPVCARNFVSNKQDCRLETTLEYAKKVEKLKFRYNDLKVKNVGLPREISEITFCKP